MGAGLAAFRYSFSCSTTLWESSLAALLPRRDAEPAHSVSSGLNVPEPGLLQSVLQLGVPIDGHAVDKLRPFAVLYRVAALIADEERAAAFQHAEHLTEAPGQIGPEIDRLKGCNHVEPIIGKKHVGNAALQDRAAALPDGLPVDLLRLFHADGRIVDALDTLEKKVGSKVFPLIFQSITCDNGCEFADAAGIERSITGRGPRTEVYYCHPYRPSERGSNENQNGLIRRHLPKGTDLSTISYEETKRIEDWLNNYPRKMFGFLCSEQLFREEIALILAS